MQIANYLHRGLDGRNRDDLARTGAHRVRDRGGRAEDVDSDHDLVAELELVEVVWAKKDVYLHVAIKTRWWPDLSRPAVKKAENVWSLLRALVTAATMDDGHPVDYRPPTQKHNPKQPEISPSYEGTFIIYP